MVHLTGGMIGRGVRDHRLHMLRGMARIRLGDAEGALDDFGTAEDLGGDELSIAAGRGSALVSLNEHARALAAFEEAVALGGGAVAHFARGVVLMDMDRSMEAEHAFDTVVSMGQADPVTYQARAMLKASDGRYFEAFADVGRALLAFPWFVMERWRTRFRARSYRRRRAADAFPKKPCSSVLRILGR